jgi:hypothetical protein
MILAAAGAGGSPVAPSRWSSRPPQPSLTTLGVTRTAVLVSYCWADRGRPETTACADGSLARVPVTLPWRPRAEVRLDLHLPAHDVDVVASHQSVGRGGRVIQTRLHLRTMDSAGRRWAFQIPPRTRVGTDLLVSAHFAQGDVFAAVALEAAG